MSDNPKPIIDADTCTGCTICVDECPTAALGIKEDTAELVSSADCTGCGACEEVCPVSAILME